MQNFLKYLFLLILIMFFLFLFYCVYFIIQSNKQFEKNVIIKKWQKERLVLLIQNRIKTIEQSGKMIDINEKELLIKLIQNINNIKKWNDIEKIIKNPKICAIINVAIMDDIYISKIDTIESKNNVVQNLFLLDCVNGGVKFDTKNPICYPKNIDIKKTIITIINNQEELTTLQSDLLNSEIATAWNKSSPDTFNNFKKQYINNYFKNLISDSAVEKTLLELTSKQTISELSTSAKFVIFKIINEILSNIIYSNNKYKKLDENAKIYIRILSDVITDKNYDIIYRKLNN